MSDSPEIEVSNAEVNEYLAGIINLKYDVKQRTMYLTGKISEESASQFIIVIHFLDSISHEPIRIFLNSAGGEDDAGFAIYDAIRLAKSPVLIDGIGMVYSMASVILQAGDVRRLAPNATFMIHNGSMTMSNEMEINELVSMGDHLKEGCRKVNAILAQRSKLTLAEVDKLSHDETFMDAATAVRKGFADFIWTPRKKRTTKLYRKWIQGYENAED